MRFIDEIKIHKNKATQRFRCRLVHCGSGYLVLLYRSDAEARVADITIARGTTTIAHYWEDRGYVLWRMFHAEEGLLGTLFHICKNVVILHDSVSYHDLIVDIWISREGALRVLDEDELVLCRWAGNITRAEEAWIERQKHLILARHALIIEEVRCFDAQHAASSSG